MSFLKKTQERFKVKAAEAEYYKFIDDASYMVMDKWKSVAKREYTTQELERLSEDLQGFFSGVIYDWFKKPEEEDE